MAARKTGTAVAKWEEELAKQAQAASAMEEGTATGSFFSLRGGVLSINDMPMPDNQMAVIILESVLENVYYEGEYDPDSPEGPTCYAYGHSVSEMEPFSAVVEAGKAQCENCAACEFNKFGTARRGRGKACKNTRRLCMIPAGSFNDKTGKFEIIDDEDHFKSSGLSFMRLPITSVKGYAGFVKQVANALKRPPFGIITKVSVVKDDDTQFKVVFEPIGNVPDELMPIIMDRHEEAAESTMFAYAQFDDDDEAPRKKTRSRRAPAKKTARGRGKY